MKELASTNQAALRRRLFARASRALGDPVDWSTVNAGEAATGRPGTITPTREATDG